MFWSYGSQRCHRVSWLLLLLLAPRTHNLLQGFFLVPHPSFLNPGQHALTGLHGCLCLRLHAAGEVCIPVKACCWIADRAPWRVRQAIPALHPGLWWWWPPIPPSFPNPELHVTMYPLPTSDSACGGVQQAIQIFTMAFVVVVASVGLMMPIMLYVFNLQASGWTWQYVGLFVSMLASTDAVAIISTMKTSACLLPAALT